MSIEFIDSFPALGSLTCFTILLVTFIPAVDVSVTLFDGGDADAAATGVIGRQAGSIRCLVTPVCVAQTDDAQRRQQQRRRGETNCAGKIPADTLASIN